MAIIKPSIKDVIGIKTIVGDRGCITTSLWSTDNSLMLQLYIKRMKDYHSDYPNF